MHAPALRDLGVFYPGRPVDGTTASSGVEWTTMRSLWTLLHSERKYSDRRIFAAGARAVRAIVESLAEKAGPFDLVAASGKKRAIQTAAIWAEATGYPAVKIAETAALAPNATQEAYVGS